MANTTLLTVADYVADARTLLLDKVVPYRYDDPSLLTALNVAMLEGSRLRPDLFIYQGDGSVPTFAAVDTTVVSIDVAFRLGFLFGLCAHALLRDEEDVQDARANTFNGNFHEILIGVRPQPTEGGTPQQPAAGARR